MCKEGKSMSRDLNLLTREVDFLLSPAAIRARAKSIFDFTVNGHGSFSFQEEKFKPALEYVLQTIHKNYPDNNIPFHSRWGHFRAGGVDRSRRLKSQLKEMDRIEQARVQLDLVIPSVLLDAGAGAAWKYFEESSEQSYNRSEGLGVASFHMFLSGIMAGDKKSLRADKEGLRSITSDELSQMFQVSESNPLLAVEGRVKLLNNLAQALENKMIFKDGRPGNIIDYVQEKYGKVIPAAGLLRAVLDGFGAIWPGRLTAHGVNLGDVWMHSKLAPGNILESLVPFHKLSQWMTYSLIEPMQDAGLTITGVEGLTGLAEYRNGGLFVDADVIRLKNPEDAKKAWTPDSDLIIEWRALTVHLLDRMGEEVQKKLGKTPAEFPLAKVLEGGTWWAGRFLAKEKRENGDPPLQIQSDGTVF
jgi:hypothetical protein